MLMTTFKTVEEALEQELHEALEHAEELKIIGEMTSVQLWYFKSEGMRWLNPKPEEKKQ